MCLLNSVPEEIKMAVMSSEKEATRLADAFIKGHGRLAFRDVKKLRSTLIAAYLWGVTSGVDRCRISSQEDYALLNKEQRGMNLDEYGQYLGNLQLLAGASQNRACELINRPDAKVDLNFFLKDLS